MDNSASQIRPLSDHGRSVWDANLDSSLDQSTHSKSELVKDSLEAGDSVIKKLFLVVFGMILCGVPLAVMSALYSQKLGCSTAINTVDSTTISTSTFATVFTATTSTTTVSLPSQCTSYTANNDSTRNIVYGAGAFCDNTLTSGWYRFLGGAGRYLATNPVSRDTCATYYGGWYSGSLPSTVGMTTFGSLCLNNNGYLCYATWSGSLIGVTNCSGYYVYYLLPMTNCNARYCTTT